MTFKEILDEVIKIKIKTPEKFQKVAKYVRNHFKYVISSIFILFSWVYQWCIIAFKQDSKSNDFETIKAIFDFFLSYVLVTLLKEKLKKFFENRFEMFKNYKKKFFLFIIFLVICIVFGITKLIPILFFRIITIFVILLPLLLSTFLFFISDDTEKILESFVFTSLFISLGFIITIFFIIFPLIPNFDPIKFIYKYLFIIFIEMFELIDKNFDIDKKQKKYIKVEKKI